MKQICFATNNKKKLEEIQNQIGNQFKIISLAEIDCFDDIPENEPTIEGNSLAKAVYIFNKYNIPCFADDTGLEVEMLNGEPGVYSARYAGPENNAEANMNKVLEKLTGISNRKANFKTVISYIDENQTISFEGIVNGEITTEKSGEKGFGYDPIFKPFGFDITFAEMTMEEKNKISHRGIAVTKLISFLETL